jgi:phosphoglycerate dehydrogenase-like enzyme
MVTVLHHTPPDQMLALHERFPEVRFMEIPRTGALDDTVRGEVLLTTAIGADTLVAALERGVRWVHTIGTGVDRFPVESIHDDQLLTCSRGASAIPIAEWTLAMMLAFEKRLPDSWLTAPPEPPRRWFQAELGGLFGETIAVIGMGAIGTEVARRALSFGMRVRGVRRRSGAGTPLAGVSMTESATEAVRGARHVVVATPLTPRTHHLVNAALLAEFAPGTHLVNIARGGVVDGDALRVALDDGRVACASLDTVEPEPLPAGHWMYEHPRVRVSPHISWSMPTNLTLLYATFAENLARFLRDDALDGVVDRVERY